MRRKEYFHLPSVALTAHLYLYHSFSHVLEKVIFFLRLIPPPVLWNIPLLPSQTETLPMIPQSSFPQSLSFFLLVIELLVCSSTSIFSLPSYSLFNENWLLGHYSTENDHSKLTSNINISKLYRSARFSIVDHILLKTFSSFSLLRHQILLMYYLVI